MKSTRGAFRMASESRGSPPHSSIRSISDSRCIGGNDQTPNLGVGLQRVRISPHNAVFLEVQRSVLTRVVLLQHALHIKMFIKAIVGADLCWCQLSVSKNKSATCCFCEHSPSAAILASRTGRNGTFLGSHLCFFAFRQRHHRSCQTLSSPPLLLMRHR